MPWGRGDACLSGYNKYFKHNNIFNNLRRIEISDIDLMFANNLSSRDGIINFAEDQSFVHYEDFVTKFNNLKVRKSWKKNELVKLFKEILPNFNHEEKQKNLDQKM